MECSMCFLVLYFYVYIYNHPTFPPLSFIKKGREKELVTDRYRSLRKLEGKGWLFVREVRLDRDTEVESVRREWLRGWEDLAKGRGLKIKTAYWEGGTGSCPESPPVKRVQGRDKISDSRNYDYCGRRERQGDRDLHCLWRTSTAKYLTIRYPTGEKSRRS